MSLYVPPGDKHANVKDAFFIKLNEIIGNMQEIFLIGDQCRVGKKHKKIHKYTWGNLRLGVMF